MIPEKVSYSRLCDEEHVPIFLRPFWLDATSENWDVSLVEKGGQIIGAMPYTITQRFGSLRYLGQPPLTQYLGPWIRPSTGKYSKRLGREKEVMQALISQLPKYDFFQQNWSYTNQNWLPFYWKGFEQTTRYTYVIENLKDLDLVFDGFQEKVRTDIRKASTRHNLTVVSDAPIDDFIELNRMVYERQSMDMIDSERFVRNLIRAAKQHEVVKWFVAYDEESRPHAGVLIVWDEESAYYLLGGGNPSLRNSGATSLCMWEAIKYSSKVTRRFDFEGSMIEPVERFVRGFGASQKPYFQVSHTPSQLLRVAKAFKAVRR